MRTLTLCWLALLALAVTGVLLGGAGDSPWLLAAVLACAVAKGWLIGERFMELAHAPALWRRPAARRSRPAPATPASRESGFASAPHCRT